MGLATPCQTVFGGKIQGRPGATRCPVVGSGPAAAPSRAVLAVWPAVRFYAKRPFGRRQKAPQRPTEPCLAKKSRSFLAPHTARQGGVGPTNPCWFAFSVKITGVKITCAKRRLAVGGGSAATPPWAHVRLLRKTPFGRV